MGGYPSKQRHIGLRLCSCLYSCFCLCSCLYSCFCLCSCLCTCLSFCHSRRESASAFAFAFALAFVVATCYTHKAVISTGAARPFARRSGEIPALVFCCCCCLCLCLCFCFCLCLCLCFCFCFCFSSCHSERSEEPASRARSARPFFPSLIQTPHHRSPKHCKTPTTRASYRSPSS